MRIPITRDGFGVLAAMTVVLAVVGAVGAVWTPWAWCPVLLVWLWGLWFFRDPERRLSCRSDTYYAPADGRVTSVTELDDHELIGGPCVRIRIFLSIFNVHVNRMPCAGRMVQRVFKAGRFMNAMRPESAEENESNTLVLEPVPPLAGPVVVRQISGMIARTIVCHVREGDELGSGQRFGMIKFGSGTELTIPRQQALKILAAEGDKVRAGLTELARIEE